MPTAKQVRDAHKRLRAGNPVLWLKDITDKAKMPEAVRAHINELFKQHTTYMGIDPDDAYPIALRISARINWARAQHSLLNTDPLSKAHFTVSKVVSQWVANQAKSQKTQPVGRSPGDGRLEFPSTSENTEEADGDSESD